MSQQNVEIVRRGYALFIAGDFEGVAQMMSDDAVIADAAGLGRMGTRVGPKGWLAGLGEMQEAFADYSVEIQEFIDAGEEAVVVPVRISGRGKASGVDIRTRVAHLWTLRDGKLIRGQVFETTKEALEAAGLQE